MPVGSRRHLVPQMMIRRFAGEDGKLSELYKPKLVMGTRRRSPKGILFLEGFYRDHLGDFDDELLTPIEQKFARFYPSLADEANPKPLAGKGGAALIDWIAAMLVRTRAHVFISEAVAHKEAGQVSLAYRLAPALMNNIARTHWFSEYQDLLSRPNVRWKIKTYRDDEVVVLSDHPVCQTNGLGVGGQVTIVPLSKRRVLFGGHQDAVDGCNIPVEYLNTFAAAWAERSIFAADSRALQTVARNLRGEGLVGTPEWCEAARRPFFGFSDRLKDRQPPVELDVSQWWEQIKDSYGESILPERPRKQ